MLPHTVMRAALGFWGVLAMSAVVGCGPGLTRHSQQAKAPAHSEVFDTMNAELKNAFVGTTSLTSADPMPLPGERLPVAQWDDDDGASAEPPAGPARTWGAGARAASDDASDEKAPAAREDGAKAKIPAEIPARRDPLSFP